jgi:hypothetical protein
MNDLMREMANAPRGTITLGGRTFPLVELNWNDYCAIEDEFGRDASEWRGMRASRFILWLGLRKHDPALTLEQVGALVTSEDFDDVSDAIRTIMGQEGAESPGGNP